MYSAGNSKTNSLFSCSWIEYADLQLTRLFTRSGMQNVDRIFTVFIYMF